ncbi:hypothetical protein R5W24_001574 [Gemmata sp. JC717]|uniref:DUF3105 domain-containing protein n=1 Tax=Gemmata algarum TaxID=2975278 RepID=A0ABU5EUQ8_9BACT|nr:hypothetical protein [Gemmata algarum]MDY3552491.1 hypothetical protein [Gemmata algarum]MDY3558925.1 hypothetical protein [Gemmata algarum]
MSWIRRKLWVLAVGVLAGASGCNPFTLGFLTPIPVQPWVAERMDQKFNHQNDGRVPIMPPVRDGFPPPICEDEPSDQEVLRAMPRVPRGVPGIYETFRDDISIVKNRLVDKIDPPRFFPLVGQAQLHHCHWECVVYYTELVQSDYPFPTYRKKQRVQVIYIDKDHLHLYVGTDPATQKQITQDLTRY